MAEQTINTKVTVYITNELLIQAQHAKVDRHISLSALFEEALREYLK